MSNVTTRQRVPARIVAVLAVAVAVATSAGVAGASSAQHRRGRAVARTAARKSCAPISIGAVSDVSGQYPYTESTQAAQAVFDEQNANGGINCHPIKYYVADTAESTTQAASGLVRLLTQDNVVALAGGASSEECPINVATIERYHIYEINQAEGDPCFNSPNIAPITATSATGLTLPFVYLAKDLKISKVCDEFYNIPTIEQGTQQAEREFTQVTGDKIYKSIFDNITGAPDLTSIVSQLANSGCKAFFFIGEPSTVESILQVANQQHLLGKVVFSTLSFAYTAGLASYLKDPVYNGLSVSTNYLPFTLPASRYPGLKEFKATMTSHQVTIDGTSEGGYVEAKLMIDALKSIKGGSYTRSTVGAALRSLHNVSTDGLAPPFTWGRPVRATYFVVLKNGAWQCVNSCKPASL